MKNSIIYLSLCVFLISCKFKKTDDSIKTPKHTLHEAEKKFGVNFNATRLELGLQPIPDSWIVIFNEDYSLSFAQNARIDTVKGFAYKTITYNEKLEILSEEDYYTRKDSKVIKLSEDCDDDHVSFIYDFKLKDYTFDTFCCSECKNTAQEWDDTKEGYLRKLQDYLVLMGY